VIHPGRTKGVRFSDHVRDILVEYLERQAENMGVIHPRFWPFDRAVIRFIIAVQADVGIASFECVSRGVIHTNFDARVTASGYPPYRGWRRGQDCGVRRCVLHPLENHGALHSARGVEEIKKEVVGTCVQPSRRKLWR
jgi:hypothetical protein